MIKLSKRQYFNEYFTQNNNNSKKSWIGVKQIISLKQKPSLTPSKLVINNLEITDTKKNGHEFNTYFANIGNKLCHEIPHVKVLPINYLPLCSQAESFFQLVHQG